MFKPSRKKQIIIIIKIIKLKYDNKTVIKRVTISKYHFKTILMNFRNALSLENIQIKTRF